LRRIISKQAAWYGDGGNGANVNINPSRWEGDGDLLSGRTSGPRTEEDIKELWGKGDKKDKKKKKSDKKKHKVDCPCGKKCKCDGPCKCRKQ